MLILSASHFPFYSEILLMISSLISWQCSNQAHAPSSWAPDIPDLATICEDAYRKIRKGIWSACKWWYFYSWSVNSKPSSPSCLQWCTGKTWHVMTSPHASHFANSPKNSTSVNPGRSRQSSLLNLYQSVSYPKSMPPALTLTSSRGGGHLDRHNRGATSPESCLI